MIKSKKTKKKAEKSGLINEAELDRLRESCRGLEDGLKRLEKADEDSVADKEAKRIAEMDRKCREWGFDPEPSRKYWNEEWLKLFMCFREKYRWEIGGDSPISDDDAAKYLAEIAVITKAYRLCDEKELEELRRHYRSIGKNRLIAGVIYQYPTFRATPDGMIATVLSDPATEHLPIWECGSPDDDPSVHKALVRGYMGNDFATGYTMVQFSADKGGGNGNVYGLFQNSDPMEKFVYEAIYWEERRLLANDWRKFKSDGTQYARISDTPGYLYGRVSDNAD